MKPILDMTAGSRMFWWDKHNPLAIFFDKRRAVYEVEDNSHGKHGFRKIEVNPDVQGDWTIGLPFDDERFVPLMREKFPDLTIKAKKWKNKHTQWITNIPYTKQHFKVTVSWAKAELGDTDD